MKNANMLQKWMSLKVAEVDEPQIGDIDQAGKPASEEGERPLAHGVAIESQAGKNLDEYQREHQHVGHGGECIVAHVVRDVPAEERVIGNHAAHSAPLPAMNGYKSASIGQSLPTKNQ